MIDFREVRGGETWEFFARDFLEAIGLAIEEGPDRGPDMGRDLLVTEHLQGRFGHRPFRWMVSCKHHARSKAKNAVTEDEEKNIRERLEGFRANGFLGFYSTIASANLNKRLGMLRRENKIEDYRILDHKLIENYLIQLGFSPLVMRYFPNSYKSLKPLHRLWGEYIPLECDVCQKDLLEEMQFKPGLGAILGWEVHGRKGSPARVESLYWVCKRPCMDALERRHKEEMGWFELSDLAIPTIYLHRIMIIMKRLQDGWEYSKQVLAKEYLLMTAMGQKVFRELTEGEREKARDIIELLKTGF